MNVHDLGEYTKKRLCGVQVDMPLQGSSVMIRKLSNGKQNFCLKIHFVIPTYSENLNFNKIYKCDSIQFTSNLKAGYSKIRSCLSGNFYHRFYLNISAYLIFEIKMYFVVWFWL